MSITVSTDVVCDECGEWIHGVTDGRVVLMRSARRVARLHGWLHRGGRDLCPECSKVR